PNLQTLDSGLDAALQGISNELVVVLNGIAPESADVPDRAKTVAFPVNRGVAPAWNAAVAASSADVLCLINDDVILGPGCVRGLVGALLAHPAAGVVGPVGTMWDLARPQHESWLDLSDTAAGGAVECDVVSGFFFATRRAVYDEVGGFDEAYAPCGFEE